MYGVQFCTFRGSPPELDFFHLQLLPKAKTYIVRPTGIYKRSQTWTGILDAERVNRKSKTTRESTNSQTQQSVHTTLENDRCKSGFKHLFYN